MKYYLTACLTSSTCIQTSSHYVHTLHCPSRSNLYSRLVVCGPCQTGTISSSRSSPSPLVWSGSRRSVAVSGAGPCCHSLHDPETPHGPGGQSSERGRGAGWAARGPSAIRNKNVFSHVHLPLKKKWAALFLYMYLNACLLLFTWSHTLYSWWWYKQYTVLCTNLRHLIFLMLF